MQRREALTAGLAAIPASVAVAQGEGSEFAAGAASRIITPMPYLPVSGGLGPSRPTKDKRGELTARAVVYGRGRERVCFVALDLLGFPSVLCDRVRALVPRLAPDRILIGSTHTHSAPDCYAFPDGKGGHTGNLDYMDRVCKEAAAAVNAALDKMEPATLRVASGEVNGKIAYNYYAPDLYDRRAGVLQAVSKSGKTISTLVNYAVHPEVLGADVGLVSPDLVGPMCDRIEAKAGGLALFLNGAQGGMVTADNRDFKRLRDPLRGYWDDDRTWEECLRIGNTLAEEALRLIGSSTATATPSLFVASKTVKLPVESPLLWAVVQGSPLRYPYGADRTVSTRLNLVNLGPAQILTIPGEALPNIGMYLKRKMKGKHPFLFGLTNDAFGYILTRVDFNSFNRYRYVSETSLGEETGEILLKEWMDLVRAAPEPDR